MCYNYKVRSYLLLFGLTCLSACSPKNVEPSEEQAPTPSEVPDAEGAYTPPMGRLKEILKGAIPQTLKLKGILNKEDFAFLREHSPEGALLDLSELFMTELPNDYSEYGLLEGAKYSEVILPKRLIAVPEKFLKNSSIARLTIHRGIVRIGDEAFRACESLQGTLQLPQTILEIGKQSFSECRALRGTLTLPKPLQKIGEGAFNRCTGFDGSLILPTTLKVIGRGAFSECRGFTGQLIIPHSVEQIGNDAFFSCSGFTGELVLSKALREIDFSIFSYCRALSGKLIIPNLVTKISEFAFAYCSNIQELVLPESVAEIEQGAFRRVSGSRALERVYSRATAPSPKVGKAFWGLMADDLRPKTLYVPQGTKVRYQAIEGWSVFERIEEMDVEQMPK